MKNRNTEFTAILLVLAFALAPMVHARPGPSPGPTYRPANEHLTPDGENLPVVTVHSTGDVTRGKTGSFVLNMTPPIMFGGTYVNFSVSGTAVSGVDYLPLLSPGYIGQSGYGVILVHTLPDPRGSSSRQAYSVVVTLEPGLGYFLGEPKSAKMMIKP
jgi:hypothetical protein